MRQGTGDSMHRLQSSNFCWDANRWGPVRFTFYVLENGPDLQDQPVRLHVEQLYMDALRDQTDWEDYSGRPACSCGDHPAARKYVRRKPRIA
jgi:hypothetical protein